MTTLSVQGLGKCYRIYASPRARLKEMLLGRPAHVPHWALRDVSFELRPGDSVGIIGDNGAGKSTLLKLVAGTLRPTTGRVAANGRLTAILELGAGFHPEFTGRDNIFFAGTLMGIGRAELERRCDDIVAFAELEQSIDQPVKTYSSGMFVRLAFSLVTSVEPEILIVDEALAVGDQHFQKRCIDRMADFARRGVTILFCSHSMHHIHQFCGRALWLEEGTVVADGVAEEVIKAYTAAQLDDAGRAARDQVPTQVREADRFCRVERLRVVGAAGEIERGEPLLLEMDYTVLRSRLFSYGLAADRKDGVRILAESLLGAGRPPVHHDPGRYRVRVELDSSVLAAGTYDLSLGLLDETLLHLDDFRTLRVQVTDVAQNRLPAMARASIRWGESRDLGVAGAP